MVSAERPRTAPIASIRKRITTYMAARLEQEGKSLQFAISTEAFLEHPWSEKFPPLESKRFTKLLRRQ